MDEASQDPVVRQLREQISDNDRAIVEALNKRLKLVGRLWEYKASRGYEVLVPEREGWMLNYLQRANRGPVSPEGLEEVYRLVLDLTKREVGLPEDQQAEAAG
ncbi:MAG TPA: chorismate mutase [Gaiellaceae bacterium]|jgi:chorismate mutase